MRLRELFEDRKKKVVAVMPGGFHLFHPGHKSLYDWAVKTFGQDNVYVAATDDTKSRPFPFNIKQQLASMAGVPKERFIQVKSPFNALSYQSLLNDAENTALVFVRSDKDQASHPKPDQIRKSDGQMGYIISYDGNLEHGADMHGYMTYGPTQDFNFSGLAIRSASELRAAWPEMGDEDKLQAANLMYPGKGEEASKMLDTALGINGAVSEESISESPLVAWPAVAYALTKIPPNTYAGAATAIGASIAKAIKHFEELIKKNPKHPKVSKVKAALAWLMITKAQALADETASPNDAASAESISETKPDMNKVLTALKKKLKDEGGAAGFKPLKDVASKMDIDLTPAMLKKMSGIKMHRDGDYILEEVKNV